MADEGSALAPHAPLVPSAAEGSKRWDECLVGRGFTRDISALSRFPYLARRAEAHGAKAGRSEFSPSLALGFVGVPDAAVHQAPYSRTSTRAASG